MNVRELLASNEFLYTHFGKWIFSHIRVSEKILSEKDEGKKYKIYSKLEGFLCKMNDMLTIEVEYQEGTDLLTDVSSDAIRNAFDISLELKTIAFKAKAASEKETLLKKLYMTSALSQVAVEGVLHDIFESAEAEEVFAKWKAERRAMLEEKSNE